MAKLELSAVSTEQPIDVDVVADARLRQRLIGKALRDWFDSVRAEPVPNEMLDLISRIDSEAREP